MPVCVIIPHFDGSMKFHPGLGGNLTVLVHSSRFFDDDERTIANQLINPLHGCGCQMTRAPKVVLP